MFYRHHSIISVYIVCWCMASRLSEVTHSRVMTQTMKQAKVDNRQWNLVVELGPIQQST